jgi:phosphoribosylformimino-5-aminoimidazole carboxamide ribotide isomerase
VTYAGGVHDLKDLDQIRSASDGYLDVTVGSALDLFGGSLSLDDLTRACR